MARCKEEIGGYHQYRNHEHAKDDKTTDRIMGCPLVTSYEEVKQRSQRGKDKEIYDPDYLCGEMPEVIPDDIDKGIEPDDGRQDDYGNKTHEYDKCDHLYSLLIYRAFSIL